MANFENPLEGIEFADEVAARRDGVRADLDVQFSDAKAPTGTTGVPAAFSFRVADFARPKQESGGIEFVDFPKTLAGGAIKGAGSAVRGVGKVAEGLGRVGVTALNQAFDAGLDAPTNPLEGAADTTHRLGERVLDSRTDEAKRREADSQPAGDLDKPDTWTFGRDPSASGLLLQGMNALGSSALPIAAAAAAGPLGIGARMAAGAAAGGAQGGGNAIEQARETIDGMDDEQLAAASSAYRDLVAKGATPDQARARIRAEAEEAAFVRTVPVSALGGAATGRILSPAGRVLGDRGVVAQTLGRAGLAGTEEAVQELGEGVATQKGINAGAGMELDPLAGSFGNAALGFVAGMGPGAVHGAADGVRSRGTPTAPSLEAGDVMHASGKPFVTASAARQRAAELGEGAQVMRHENGFIVRPGRQVEESGTTTPPKTPTYSPSESIWLRDRGYGQEVPVEFLGAVDIEPSTQAGGEPMARVRTEDGEEKTVPMAQLDREFTMRVGGTPPSAGSEPALPNTPDSFTRGQQVYLRQNGRELPVEFLGVERNAATARPGGEPLARVRTADGRGRFVRLSVLAADPLPGNALREAMDGPAALEGPQAFPVLDGPIERQALPAPEDYAAGEGFTARESWRMPANAPRGIRNNNPGNIEKGVGFDGEVEGNDPRFATFKAPEDGIRGLAVNLLTYQRRHGLDTVQGIIGRWAPDSENETGAYVQQVSRVVGVQPDDRLDLSNPTVLARLTAAIIQHENGMQPYTTAQMEEGIDAALKGTPARAALPAPVYQVDGQGVAATSGQRDAELARQAAMGMTPDVAAAGARHPGAATDTAAHEAATSPSNSLPEPSEAQKAAGNYKVGRTRVAGLELSIENPEGSERRGTSPDGTQWANRMAGHYGYIRRTEGADGDQVDVFVRPGTAPDFSGPVFVVDQVDPATGKFDEAKVMLGYSNQKEAEKAYRASYDRNWKGMGKLTKMEMPVFKEWLNRGNTTKSAADSNLGMLAPEEADQPPAAKALPSTRSRARAITLEPGPDGKFAVSVEARETGRLKVDGGTLTSRDQVASALASLRKAPQEQMVALFTDEAGRPISILRHSIGGKSSTGFVQGLVAGHGARLRAAANVWLAHNHPSGNATLSKADVAATDAYNKLSQGGRVRLRGMLAIGKSDYGHYDPESGEQGSGRILPTRRGREIPVTERVFHQRATLANGLAGPEDAQRIMREVSGGDDGIMLLNAKNEPIAFVPMTVAEMDKLRGTGGLDKVLAGIERSNASAAILNVASASDVDAARNLGRMLKDADVQVHDIIADGQSMTSLGTETATTKSFQSRASNQTPDKRTTVSVQESERVTRDFMSKLPGAASLRVSVVETVDQIPEGAKPSPLAEGAYYPAGDGGRIYLVAENLPTAERLQQVLAHEVVGHFGVEAVLGDRFRDVLADVRRLARAPDGAQIPRDAGPEHQHYATFEAVTARYPDYSAENRAREVLARMAEQGKRPLFLERLYGKIRAALRRLGLNLQLNNTDIKQMVIDAGRFLRRAPAARVSAGMQEAAASLAAESRRGQEPVELPAVVIGQRLGAAGKHPDHAAAKAGDTAAAVRLIQDVLSDEAVAQVREAIGGDRPAIVPVLAVEATGHNKIPAVAAMALGARLGLPVEAGIYQSVKAKRTTLDGLGRIFQQPEFDGKVEPGKAYFLVDDTLTQGGTIAALASHIQQNGGRVVGSFALTGKLYSATLRLSPETLSELRARYGDVEQSFREATGRGFDALTESEGRYLAKHDAPDAVRDRILAERHARVDEAGRRTPEEAARPLGRDANEEAPPSAGLSTSGPMESRAAGAATAGAPPAGPAAAREPKRGAKIARPGETLSDIERRQRNKFLGKIGAWAEQEPIKERMAKVSDRWQAKLVQGIFDQFAPLKGISATAYMQARLSKGADGAAEYLVRHGAVRLQDGALDTSGGAGLAEILAGLNGEHDHFMAWIAANRAQRLAAEWQVRFKNGVTERFADEAAARAEAARWPGAKAEAASRERLFTPEDIAAGMRLADGRMADGRERSTVYRDALRQFNELQRSVMDVAQQAGLVDPSSRALWESEFYVPFYRVMEDDATGTMGPGQIGGLVGQHAYKRLKGGTDKLGDLVANTVSNWSHLLSASMKNLAAQGALQEAEKLGIASRVRQAERGSVRAMFDGQERHYLVDDPLVMNALTSLHYVGSNDPFTKAARKFKHALTVGVTISPTFRVRNLLRDTIQAMSIDSNLSTNPLRNLVEGWRATGAESDTWRRLMAGGGAVRFGSFNDGNARNVKRLVDELGAHPDDVITSPAGMGRAMRRAFDWYQETGDRAETINRAAIYQQARNAGRSHLEASYAARDLMDFTAGGTFSAVRLLSQVVPFFNARLQGMYKLGRGAAADPARFAVVSGAVAMASALLYLGMKDDDDYKQLPDWARNSFWITKLPGTNQLVYIPKPFEIGALGSVVERGTELAFGGDDFRLGDFGRTVGAILSEQLSMNPVPQIVKPAMEAAFNYDSFRERAIDSVGQQRLPAGDRFTASTSAGAVALGRTLGLSPQRLEHLVRGYFGWLGTQALNASDYLARPLSGLPENPRRDLGRMDNWFVLGDFVKEADPRSSKYIQRFYDEQREINQVYAAYSQARELGDLERARALAGDDQLRLRALFKTADGQLREVNTKIKALERSSLPAEEKRAQLDLLYRARGRLAMLADEHARAARR